MYCLTHNFHIQMIFFRSLSSHLEKFNSCGNFKVLITGEKHAYGIHANILSGPLTNLQWCYPFVLPWDFFKSLSTPFFFRFILLILLFSFNWFGFNPEMMKRSGAPNSVKYVSKSQVCYLSAMSLSAIHSALLFLKNGTKYLWVY